MKKKKPQTYYLAYEGHTGTDIYGTEGTDVLTACHDGIDYKMDDPDDISNLVKQVKAKTIEEIKERITENLGFK